MLAAYAQRLFYFLVWSRFKQNALCNFVDLCSMSNVSVLLMTERNYGYYIHGRSPHGRADVSHAAMTLNMAREEVRMYSLCSLYSQRVQFAF